MTATTFRHAQAQPSLLTVLLDEESDPAQLTITTESPSLGGPVAVRGPSGPPFDRDREGKESTVVSAVRFLPPDAH